MKRGIPVLLMLVLLDILPATAFAQMANPRLERARDLINQAWADIRAGRPGEAVPKAREALELRERALGPSHVAVAVALHTLARGLQDGGDSATARPLAERALRIREQALGADDPLVAESLSQLGLIANNLGDFPAALAAHERALGIREKARGPDHLEVAASLYNVVRVYSVTGDSAKARPLAERALRIREQALGADDPLVAESLSQLGLIAINLGDFPAALAANERALGIREKARGPDHLEVATSLHNLGRTYRFTGEYAKARPLLDRALKIREDKLGPSHPDVAATLDELGTLLRAMDDLATARTMIERGLRIREAAFGPDSLQVAQSLQNLGWVLYWIGDYAGAKGAFQRALAIRRQALGPEHLTVGWALAGLGMVGWIQGDFPASRAAFEQSLAIQEKERGVQHPDLAALLNDYSLLLRSLGDYTRARAALERALAINERAFGPDSRNVGQTLYNLAQVLEVSGNYARAQALNDRALAIRERVLGPNHFDVALSLTLAASLRVANRDYAGAKPLYERALRIYESTRGSDHRNVALVLTSLSRVYRQTGDAAGARQILQRSLAIQERALGPEHPEVAWTLNHLGYLALDERDLRTAAPLFERALAIARKVNAPDVGWRAATGLGRIKERERKWAEAMAFHREAVKELETLGGQFSDEGERARFLQTGNRLSAYDALARALLKLHEKDQSKGYDQEAFAVLDAKKKRIAAETLSAARPIPHDPNARAELESAQAKRDEALAIEQDLREEQAKSTQERQPEKIHTLTRLLAQTKAEYLAQVQGFLQRYPKYKSQFVDQQTVDPKALAKFADRLPKGTLAVQYFAAPEELYLFVVAPGGKFQVKTQAVSQAELFRLVTQYRELVERGVNRPLPWHDDGSETYRQDVAPLKAITTELSGHLLRPIEPELRASQGFIVIPNDLLLYLPIHALTRDSPDGAVPRFLAETHALSYVTQLELTDLLGPAAAAPDAPLLALANPDGSLPAASREVRALARLLPRVTLLDGPQATKASFLTQASGFSNLHLATHGVLDPVHPERSYLLLAGAEEAAQRLGIDEIGGLSLQSALTVLSACETALGEQVPGAALITLAAAFSQAGSQSIVASLWSVNDAATRDFMVAFYGSLASGRAAALQKAQTTLLGDRITAHPFYWAPFILIGAR